MNNRILAAVFVIVIIGSAGAGYFVGTSIVSKPTSQTTVATTSCTILGPTIGVVIRVLQGGLFQSSPAPYPVVGARVGGEAAGYCNNALQTMELTPNTTNSSGWAKLLDGGFGVYNLDVSYPAGNLIETYHLSISMQPTTVTYVTFNTTTGNVTTHLCEYNLPQCSRV